MVGRLIIGCLLFSLNAVGQEMDSIDSAHSPKSSYTLMDRVWQLKHYLDSTLNGSVDKRYIEVPTKPWRVILRQKQSIIEVDYNQSLSFPEEHEQFDWQLNFQPPRATSIGLWVGYHGTGVSYYHSLAKNAGRYFSLSSTGTKYGVNFRYRRFNTSATKFTATDHIEGEPDNEMERNGNLNSPVWIRSAYLNGYYVFNGHRYSQAAAYNQSVIQRRSAGSFLLGATWFQSSFDYSDIENAFFVLLGRGVHTIKVHQASLGLGYGYNWVPFRGLLINIMAMPTVSVYNRVKVYKYDLNYDLSNDKGQIDDYGAWNPQTKTWANGKKHKSLLMVPEGVAPEFDWWEVEPETDYGKFCINYDLRLGIVYNWKNFFFGFQAQANSLYYKKDECKVNLIDVYGQTSLGIRF